jgi:hypothetical protein
MGGYLMDSKETRQDGNVYHFESVDLTARKNGFGFHTACRYSNLPRSRPSAYENLNRLSIAELSYTSPHKSLSFFGGRTFRPLVNRTLFYDGGGFSYQKTGLFKADFFAGWEVPTPYNADFINISQESLAGGMKLKINPTRTFYLGMDALKANQTDNGSVSLHTGKRFGRRITIAGAVVFDFNGERISYFDLTGAFRFRERDVLRLYCGREDPDVDTVNIYENLVLKAHDLYSIGYYAYINQFLQFSLDYGLLLYQDFTGNLISAKCMAFDGYFKVEYRTGNPATALDLSGGYDFSLTRRLSLNANAGYLLYELDREKDDYYACRLGSGITGTLVKKLRLSLEYIFLMNRRYTYDHRMSLKLNYNFFSRL